MKNSSERLARFLDDRPDIQIGGIAANLARIQSFSANPENGDAVRGLVEETALYLRHASISADHALQPDVAELGQRLQVWLGLLVEVTPQADDLATVANEAGTWSRRFLEKSGLLRRTA